MAFYNANKEFVSGKLLYTVGGILESKTLNVPNSARYFRFSCLTSAKDYAKAYSPITTEMQMEKYTDLELLPFVSAKFVCVGDSLTAGDFYPKGTNTSRGDTQKNYPYFLGRMLNAPIINAGKSGATPLSWWSEVHPSVDFADADTDHLDCRCRKAATILPPQPGWLGCGRVRDDSPHLLRADFRCH